MIEYPLFDGIVYRACSMEYYRSAYGGKGSRKRAGRFNRKDEAAVYVALDVMTAYTEFQGSLIADPQPCAIIAARLRARNLVDLTGDLSTSHIDLQQWASDWKDARDAVNRGDTSASCPSWRCRDLAVNAHRSGFVFPSTVNPIGRNLVYYPEDATAGDVSLIVIDDDGVIGKAAKGVV